MADQICRLSAASEVPDGACRLLVTAGPPDGRPSLLIQTDRRPFPARPLDVITYRGVRVRAQLKAMTVMQSYLAQRAATAAGADDAILVDDEGRIFEGATSNMFLVRGGGLVTPPAEGAILPGVLRAKVEELAEAAGITVVEAWARVADLRPDDGMLLTSSVRGIVPVGTRRRPRAARRRDAARPSSRARRRRRGRERHGLPPRLPLTTAPGGGRPGAGPPVFAPPAGLVSRGMITRSRLLITVVVAAVALVALATWGLTSRDTSPSDSLSTSGASGGGSGGAAAASDAASATLRAPPAVGLRRITGTYSQPVYVASPPGDRSRLFIVEKTGRIRIVRNGVLLARPFLNISTQVSNGSEQGLLSMAFHPRFAGNGRFYIDYTDRAGDTRVVSYRVQQGNPNRADTTTRRVLLAIDQPYANHNGGQLQFGPDGRLYVGMGDGGSGGDPQGNAQNNASRLGKLLRITLGSPPQVSIYAKGLRNPWRFSFDRANGRLWIGDVGQNAWEEIDVLAAGRPAGANLGWNGFEGTHVYNSTTAAQLDRSTLVWPREEYSHSVGYSVTGGYVYRGSAIPALRGFYLFADYGSGRVWAMDGPAGARARVPGLDGRLSAISSFGQDARGELYIVSLRGSVYRIVPR